MRCSLCKGAYAKVHPYGYQAKERTDFAFLLEQARRLSGRWCVMAEPVGARMTITATAMMTIAVATMSKKMRLFMRIMMPMKIMTMTCIRFPILRAGTNLRKLGWISGLRSMTGRTIWRAWPRVFCSIDCF